MNKRHHYNQLVEGKLEQLPGADTDQLWDGMKAILEEKMPQKKERRRFVPWVSGTKGLLLFSALSLITISGFSLFFLSLKQNSTTKTILHNSTSGSKTVTDENVIASQDISDNSLVRSPRTLSQNSKLRMDLEGASNIAQNKNSRDHILSQIALRVSEADIT